MLLAAGGCGDGRFVRTGELVRDTETSLVWTRVDSGNELNWRQAERYCAELALDGLSGWRLPEVQELKALYDDTLGYACGDRTCRLPDAIRLAGPYVWAGTATGSARRIYIDFQFGTTFAPIARRTLVRQVLCVRP